MSKILMCLINALRWSIALSIPYHDTVDTTGTSVIDTKYLKVHLSDKCTFGPLTTELESYEAIFCLIYEMISVYKPAMVE